MTVFQDAAPVYKGIALVVSAHAPRRKMILEILVTEAYKVLIAEKFGLADQQFMTNQPDIVLLDDTLNANELGAFITRAREQASPLFIPILLLTESNEDVALLHCNEVGADGFLAHPFKRNVVSAKFKLLARTRSLSSTVCELQKEVAQHNTLQLSEQVIAEKIYRRAVAGENSRSEHINLLIRAVSVFSGDLLLTAYHPDGSLHVLHGDFTGHGLTAAVGILPAAEVFRAMTAKGFSAGEILSAINSKLHRLLPTGMFMAACFVTLDQSLQKMEIWNAGMPDSLVLDADTNGHKKQKVKYRIKSSHLALGIMDGFDTETGGEKLSIHLGDRMLLCSDGVTEACNANREEFGYERYVKAATEGASSFQSVIAALTRFCADQELTDDVSLVEILCVPELHQYYSRQLALNRWAGNN